MTAVANSGPLIVLAKVNHLHLLPSLYGEVIIPQAVFREAVVVGRAHEDTPTPRRSAPFWMTRDGDRLRSPKCRLN